MQSFVVITLFYLQVSQSVALSGEKRLVEGLLSTYEKVGLYGRPVHNTSERVNVRIGLYALNAVVKERFLSSVLLEVHGWLHLNWADRHLMWSAQDNGGVKSLKLPIDHIWKPDIRLYNSFSPKVKMENVLANVRNDGNVTWIPPCAFEILVSSGRKAGNIYAALKFGSWTYDGFAMDIHPLSPEVDTSEWRSFDYRIISKEAQTNVKYYPCCEEPYIDVTYRLYLQPL